MTDKPPIGKSDAEIGAWLRRARRDVLRRTRAELGAAVGLHSTPKQRTDRVRAWEDGKRAVPVHVLIIVECMIQGATPHTAPPAPVGLRTLD